MDQTLLLSQINGTVSGGSSSKVTAEGGANADTFDYTSIASADGKGVTFRGYGGNDVFTKFADNADGKGSNTILFEATGATNGVDTFDVSIFEGGAAATGGDVFDFSLVDATGSGDNISGNGKLSVQAIGSALGDDSVICLTGAAYATADALKTALEAAGTWQTKWEEAAYELVILAPIDANNVGVYTADGNAGAEESVQQFAKITGWTGADDTAKLAAQVTWFNTLHDTGTTANFVLG